MNTVPTPKPDVKSLSGPASTLIVTTPPHVRPLYADPSVPAVKHALDSQAGSTFRTIPWNSPTSWNDWMQTPDGIQYHPAIIVSSEPPAYARYEWADLPVNGRFRDAEWLIPAAIHNGIYTHSTFASTEHVSRREQARVMAGFRRCIKAVCGVSL